MCEELLDKAPSLCARGTTYPSGLLHPFLPLTPFLLYAPYPFAPHLLHPPSLLPFPAARWSWISSTPARASTSAGTRATASPAAGRHGTRCVACKQVLHGQLWVQAAAFPAFCWMSAQACHTSSPQGTFILLRFPVVARGLDAVFTTHHQLPHLRKPLPHVLSA